MTLVLMPSERAALNARACREIAWALLAQAGMGLLAAALAWVFAGAAAGVSALAGAATYWLPNSWFALRLLVRVRKAVPASPVVFMVQELLKLLMAALLLWGLAQVANAWVVWPAVLLGLVFTLKGYVLLLIFRKLS